jgi:hypothetical protein
MRLKKDETVAALVKSTEVIIPGVRLCSRHHLAPSPRCFGSRQKPTL